MLMSYKFYYFSILVLWTPSDAHSVFRVLRRFEWTFNLRIASPLCWSLNPLSSSDTNFFISDTVDRFCRFYNNNRIFSITAELAQVTVSSPSADSLRSSCIRCMGHEISVRGKRGGHAREQILRVLPSRRLENHEVFSARNNVKGDIYTHENAAGGEPSLDLINPAFNQNNDQTET